MCDQCSDDPKWTTPPGTPEGADELARRTRDLITQFGHQVTGVLGDPAFFYTVGRSVYGHAELLLTGNLPAGQAGDILNSVAALENEGTIDILELAEAAQPTQLPGFDCLLRLQRVDPDACEMYGAIQLSGPDVAAVQVVWPDASGRWPEDPDFSYGPGAQPVGTTGRGDPNTRGPHGHES